MTGKQAFGIFAWFKDGVKRYRMYKGTVKDETDDKITVDFGVFIYAYDRTSIGTTLFFDENEAKKRKEDLEETGGFQSNEKIRLN